MQKLQYEASWDKALPNQDRRRIEAVFQQTNSPDQQTIVFTPLWQARNYRGELLVTVIVQNFGDSILSFHNQKIRYIEKGEILAEHAFTIPPLIIQPQTSMPWAFIFPVKSLKQSSFKDGRLELAD
ncbi:SLAP domain-containing protein [Oceanobacillus massiliensis]|uniref:SLAP domain-containing protein n=1 Tax=Oceanobacillus massiliensis TaxID=1465765 RepID=UPI000289B119|nr:SLAP domain-containing protein [Oceanobacillus massiliensis]